MSEEEEKFIPDGEVLSDEEFEDLTTIEFIDMHRIVREFDEGAPARYKGLLRARVIPREI